MPSRSFIAGARRAAARRICWLRRGTQTRRRAGWAWRRSAACRRRNSMPPSRGSSSHCRSSRELLARVRAVLRRVDPHADVVKIGALVVSAAVRSAEWRGRPLELTLTEFNVLEVLARNAGRVVSKQRLCELALGRPLAPFDRA